MAETGTPVEGFAPVFVLVDDDREASQRIALVLPSDWFFVPVYHPGLAVRYAKQFMPTAVLVAEPLEYPNGGAARLLQQLLDEVGRPAIILTEDPSPRAVAMWRRLGATACIPHPTRSLRRMDALQETLRDAIAQSEPDGLLRTLARINANQPHERKT
jgi:hypothetical protein